MPRETKSNLQTWDSCPNSSESRNWPKEDIEQSSISESTASPTTKLTRTSSTCKGLQNKFRNLWLRKKFWKTTHLRTTFSVRRPRRNSWSRQLRVTWNSATNTNKVPCQRCYSYMKLPCGGKLDMSDEMLSSIRQKIKELIADAHMTFRGTRGARHGVQPWQQHHFLAKEFMRKIGKKGIYSSILDRFQNYEVFHASQLQHNWTKEWCEYWDFSEQSIFRTKPPEHLERYATWYHFRYDPKHMERGPIKSRPDYHQTKKQVRFKNQTDVTITPRIWTQRSSTGLNVSLTIGNGTSR